MNSETSPRPPQGATDLRDVPLRLFGRYRPIAVLGHGGMATVFLASSQGPGNFTKLVVAKELRPELAGDPEFRSMFLDEARLAARLHHPNIVHTFEVLDEDLQLVIVMEYLDGQPLNRVRQRLSAGSATTMPAMIRIIADMLAGLHYAHELADYDGTPLQVVHRDVSPHNVFVTYAGETKLVDFGVAKVADASSRTRSGVIKGKLSYMAPEQALGLAVDRRADIFAAGLMLWEIVAGRRVWKGLEDVIMGRLNTGMIPRLREACPQAPSELIRIVDRATAALPADRYATASLFQAELEEYLAALKSWPTSRQAGSLVAEAFAQERDQMRLLIEEQMAQPRSPTAVRTSLPSVDERQDLSNPTGKSSQTQVTTTESWNKSTSLSKSRPAPETQAEASRARRPLFIAIAVSLAAALVAIVVSVTAMRKSTAPSTTPIAAASSATSTPEPVANASASTQPAANPGSTPPRKATLRITVQPVRARIYVDGVALQGNPAETLLLADGSTHQVRGAAPGYTPRTMSVVIDKDQTLEFNLEWGRPKGQPNQPGSSEPDLGF